MDVRIYLTQLIEDSSMSPDINYVSSLKCPYDGHECNMLTEGFINCSDAWFG